MSRTRKWKLVGTLVALGLCLLIVSGWSYYTTRPNYRLELGQESLRRGESELRLASLANWFAFAGRPPRRSHDKAQRLVWLLEAGDHPVHAHLLRGQLLFEQEKYEFALEELNAIPEVFWDKREPMRLQTASMAGQCLLKMNLPRQAERPFRYAVDKWLEDLDPHRGLIDAHRGLFVIYYDQGALTPALYHLRELARLEPTDGRPWRTMGYIAKEILEQNPTAVEYYQEALRRNLEPRAVEETHMEFGEVLVKQSKYQEALTHLEQVQAIPKVLALRAECLWTLGKPAEAKELVSQALAAVQSEPEALDALRLRARIYLDESHDEPAEGRTSRDVEEAAGLLKRALRIDPHDHVSRHLLSQAYDRMGRSADAAEQRRLLAQTHSYLQELAELNKIAMEHPWDGDVRQRLEQVCLKLNLKDLAEMWHRAAQSSAGAGSSK